MEQTQTTWKQEARQATNLAGIVLVGAGIAWLGYFLGYPTMGGIVGGFIIVDWQVKRAWHKTIRPAIIELIREALR